MPITLKSVNIIDIPNLLHEKYMIWYYKGNRPAAHYAIRTKQDKWTRTDQLLKDALNEKGWQKAYFSSFLMQSGPRSEMRVHFVLLLRKTGIFLSNCYQIFLYYFGSASFIQLEQQDQDLKGDSNNSDITVIRHTTLTQGKLLT